MDKMYYSITEVVEMTGVKAVSLRYWEDQIPQLKPKRTEGGTRRYSAEDVELVRTIKYMVEENHLTMEGICRQLANRRKLVDRDIKVIRHLESIRNELEAIRHEMNAISALDKETIID